MARQGYLRSYPSARAFALLVCGELSDSDPPMCFSVSATLAASVALSASSLMANPRHGGDQSSSRPPSNGKSSRGPPGAAPETVPMAVPGLAAVTASFRVLAGAGLGHGRRPHQGLANARRPFRKWRFQPALD